VYRPHDATFPYASAGSRVTVKDTPAVMGVRLRFAVSFTDETVPAVTAKVDEAAAVVMAPEEALMTRPVAATVGVTAIAST
jgi:hypothetical protein